VPTVTTLWPNAGWLEREVFDLYGVIFDGNTTCAGFSPTTASKGIPSARTSR
jgi:NADH:ubiquinone oxidoreductase subunit C